MKIDIIASGSNGNCIVIDDGHSKLMLDAGLPYSKLAQKVKLSELEGIFVSHSHLDHCKAVPELSRRGVNLLMSLGTADEIIKTENIYLIYTALESETRIDVGSWRILPFNTVHDCRG
jgi:Cft2 family RNA processing exonuclease